MTRLNQVNILIVLVLSATFLFSEYPDQEDLHSTVYSTIHYSKMLWQGSFPFWQTDVGLGVPQPFAHHTIYHPLLPLFGIISLNLALAAFFMFQSLLALYCIRRCCRQLDIVETVAALCGTSFILSFVTFHQFVVKVTPSTFIGWTLLPLVLFLIHATIKEISPLRRYALAFLLGLAGGLVGLNGHPGIVGSYAIVLIIYSLFYGRGQALIALIFAALVAFSVASDKIILLIQEFSILYESDNPRRGHANIQFGTYAWWSLFVKPLIPVDLLDLSLRDMFRRTFSFGGGTDPRWTDNLFIGPPLAMAAIVTFFISPLKRHLPLKVCLFFCAVVFLMPNLTDSLYVLSGNIFLGQIMILVMIFLGGAGISDLMFSDQGRHKRFGAAILWLQIVALALAVVTMVPALYNFKRAGYSQVMESATDVAEQIEPHLQEPFSRLIVSPGIESARTSPLALRNWAGEASNAMAIAGVPTLSGFFKGVAATNLYPAKRMASMDVKVTGDVLTNKSLLDVLGVSVIAALENEVVAPSLRAIGTLRGYENIRLYINDLAWPLVTALHPSARDMKSTVRDGCEHDRILCRDFAAVIGLREHGAILSLTVRSDGNISIELNASTTERLLLVTQTFRPGWKAVDQKGNELSVTELLDGMVGISVPKGIHHISLSYSPVTRIAAVSMTFFLLFAGGIVAATVLWRSRHHSVMTATQATGVTLPDWKDTRPVVIWFIKAIAIGYCIAILAFSAASAIWAEWYISEMVFLVSFLSAGFAALRLLRLE